MTPRCHRFRLASVLGTTGFGATAGSAFGFGSSFSSASRTGRSASNRGQRSSGNLRRAQKPQPCHCALEAPGRQPWEGGLPSLGPCISDRSAAALRAYNLGAYNLWADNLAQADIRRAACCSRTACR